MSLTDKVIEELREDTYDGGLVDRDESEALAGEFNRLTASADGPFGAQRMLAFAVAGEVLTLAIAMFGMNFLRWIIDDVMLALFGTVCVFLLGFFGAFAACRLYKEFISRDGVPTIDGPMSDIADYNATESDFLLYLISAGGGVANVVLVYVLLSIKI